MKNEIEVKEFLKNKFVIMTIRDGKLKYWGPDFCDYVECIYLAGLYTKEDIKKLLNDGRVNKAVEVIDSMSLFTYTNVAIRYLNLINNASQLVDAYVRG